MISMHNANGGTDGSTTTAEIAALVGGRLLGSGALRIHGLQSLADAEPGHLTFVGRADLLPAWEACAASAALIRNGLREPAVGDRALIFVHDVDLAMAEVQKLLAPARPMPAVGRHPTAVVSERAQIDPTARIGPLCLIGEGAVIGPNAILHGQVTVLDGSRIGAGCELWPGVVIRERCELGDHCILHPNVTIGADGFGYRPSRDRTHLVKIPQLGTVKIGNHVEIGASTTVDRGKFGATQIGDGTKIDNLCMIAHNCVIGRSVVMAGCSGTAGSVQVGDGVMFGGRVGVSDHLRIGRGAQLGVGSLVITDVPDGGRVIGYPAIDASLWKRVTVLLRRLPSLFGRGKQRSDAAAGEGEP